MSEDHAEKFAGVWCPAEVLLSELNANELRLWLRIRSFMGREDGECWASNDYLAKDLKQTPTHISYVIKNLAAKGFIETRTESTGKRYIKAIYTLTKNRKGGYEKSLGGVTKNRNAKTEVAVFNDAPQTTCTENSQSRAYTVENTQREIPPTPYGELLECFKNEYPRPEFNRNTIKSVDEAWAKAIKNGDNPQDILSALSRKKARLAAYIQNKNKNPFEGCFSAPIYFLIEHNRGNSNAGWRSVGEAPKERLDYNQEQVKKLSTLYPKLSVQLITDFQGESPEFYKTLEANQDEILRISQDRQLPKHEFRDLVIERMKSNV